MYRRDGEMPPIGDVRLELGGIAERRPEAISARSLRANLAAIRHRRGLEHLARTPSLFRFDQAVSGLKFYQPPAVCLHRL